MQTDMHKSVIHSDMHIYMQKRTYKRDMHKLDIHSDMHIYMQTRYA